MNDGIPRTVTDSENDEMIACPPCGVMGPSGGPSPEKNPLGFAAGQRECCTEIRGKLNFGISTSMVELSTDLNLSYHAQSFGSAESSNSDNTMNTLHEFVGKIRRPKSRLYCRRGAVVLTKNPLGKNLNEERKLRHAASKGNVCEVRKLLEEGTNPNRPDEKGRAPLHFAVTKGCHDMVQILLDKGADVNLKDGLGNTPLHLAVFSNHMGIVTTLLESGANAHELDRAGHTPVHLARSRLKHIRESSCRISSLQLQVEVIQLVSMLKVYMTSIGLAEHLQRLDQLALQVQETNATEQVDAIEDILNTFTSLSLQKT